MAKYVLILLVLSGCQRSEPGNAKSVDADPQTKTILAGAEIDRINRQLYENEWNTLTATEKNQVEIIKEKLAKSGFGVREWYDENGKYHGKAIGNYNDAISFSEVKFAIETAPHACRHSLVAAFWDKELGPFPDVEQFFPQLTDEQVMNDLLKVAYKQQSEIQTCLFWVRELKRRQLSDKVLASLRDEHPLLRPYIIAEINKRKNEALP